MTIDPANRFLVASDGIAEVYSGTLAGLGIGLLAGLVLSIVIESRHDWGKWREVGLLTIRITDEFGGYEEKKYRRFERECKECGIVKMKKVRVN